MKLHRHEQSQLLAAGDGTSQPNRRGILAGIGALVASGLGLFSLQTPAKADDDDGWGGDWDDDDGYHGGYYYDPYYGYYYDPYDGGYYYDDDDDWDDDDGWDDDDWD